MTSAESDGGSSVYPASLSDGDRGVVTSGGRWGNNSSDSSNDTYSEKGGQTPPPPSPRQPSDYDYFLSRVRHNLKLEAEVQRHIRLSESSDYETNSSAVSGDGYDTSDDIVSLTSITSLSGISLTDERESRRACAPPHSDKSRRRSHAAKTEAPSRGRTCAASDAQKQRKTKTVSFADTKKSRRTKPVEYYRLPDFPHKAVPARGRDEGRREILDNWEKEGKTLPPFFPPPQTGENFPPTPNDPPVCFVVISRCQIDTGSITTPMYGLKQSVASTLLVLLARPRTRTTDSGDVTGSSNMTYSDKL
ncbi:hypothetical protein NP493_7306g00002 [Ridgeia piscesae]|uniref:Uncharacterized protein n=1 Tax=Ridgeia piscesae TaxID=27915 RepID=A0AAD9IR20_RIDPI|nr:hypothetical protein NP493_7306g00002 [Ridgeia piscesae]